MKTNTEWRTDPIPLKNDRPICPECKKRLQPWIDREVNWATKQKHRGKIIRWTYKAYGHFCTMNCATRFANRIVNKKLALSSGGRASDS